MTRLTSSMRVAARRIVNIPYFDRVTFPGARRLPRLPPLLRAEAGLDGGQSALVAGIDPGDERFLAFGFSRQRLFQYLDDVTGRQQFQARRRVSALFGDVLHTCTIRVVIIPIGGARQS